MADLADIERIAASLPRVSEGATRGHRSWVVNGSTFTWIRPIRPRERDELGDAAPGGDTIAVRVADEFTKDRLVEHEPGVFTVSHFDGYAMVLVHLPDVDLDLLEDLVTDAWWLGVAPTLSERLARIADALPVEPGMRVLEVGCGTGALALELASRVAPDGQVLATDRSATAIEQVRTRCEAAIALGVLDARCAAASELALAPDEQPYDLAVAIRVGALDGRHPDQQDAALAGIRSMLVPDAPVFVDGGDPLRELT
jgi:hypothetical protein